MEFKSKSVVLVFLLVALLAIGSEVATARTACRELISDTGCNLKACKSACKAQFGKNAVPEGCECQSGGCNCKYYC
ncbi:hypothetical protein MLD38_009247 [Melastoma candidum]|uniref:Uncharacterized protein n=1 Tax=Melastoma candidum TaxID=119954 RepID=A0ACB9RXH4_9MYRT|nr:hypothetical protein MLD38_009247 [Melastoma candidum]